ncbi:helix-turn-helix transcriptional regulator [Mammaliicoccus sciuri]|uniref:helix-turn-helix domain-containing protein n=1 Tax=Mammaliicoccus TaxID=2803850 RepID=UPI001AAF6236|nr:helix-turn-helix transcriptional regulator [Mammaliicoccus sciuri]MBO3081001.1 helix-turn-helix transcriptional regulator [Mammaliicoccus sciuri]MCD8778003.1 helix-turn-helix transcriptional regulator [Mammaliicoccus sciuri]MCD8779684.1 helix-turn-helix transcriptional regulator [Mammaliicoccus sciuri]MCD8788782.1 helix-turn-helix transcriptional regulator [Mammaliicoccus sciuri]MCO4324321.1 helix-turn-helix transcriptional regulator [Mammaliicoccus sciuri]
MNNYEYINVKEMEVIFEYIAKELQFQRKNMGIKQKDVSKDLGMSSGNISKIEGGKANKTSFYLFLRLANYYGIGLNNLITIALERYNKDKNKLENSSGPND